ncbi:MAG: nodulation protein NfeD [Cyclobacteriaceae bacterium]|nr:nodulation protein NfeD [Cyclobacteriaceae bacterium]
MKKLKHVYLVMLALLTVIVSLSISTVKAQTKVFVMKIQAEIDPRTNRYSELAIAEAKDIGADIVVLEMDTYGGAVNDADDIRTRILEFDKPIWVFINKDAASAGALISIACDSIYMAPGASIGAATVVMGGTGEAAPDKYQSYMRSIMRSTAEANGRDPKIAEAMVDEEIAIDSITEAGKVLTFSTSEAIKYNFCEAQVNSIPDILTRNGVTDYELIEFELSLSERIIKVFLNPFISGILILVIIGGIYFELQTPGVGFPILAAIIAAVLYFVPYYLNGLAENWEIIVFFVGVVLLLVEIFVIPGFGVAGISGIVLMVGALILVMLNNDLFDFSFVDGADITKATLAALSGLFAAILLMFFGGLKFTESKAFRRIALVETQQKSQGYTSNFNMHSYLGMQGTAYTVLRPSGKIMIDGELKDAFTRGEYIDKGKPVEVIDEGGTSLKVREVQPQA